MRFAVVASWLAVSSAMALFPTPLHIVRRIDDPIAGKSETVEEYCSGNRVVTVSGPRVVIADYGAQTLTEIDHRRLTYSITRFDEIARALPPLRTADAGAKLRIEIDRSVALTREAVEVLIGSAYPNRRSEQQEKILSEAAPAGGRIAAQSVSPSAYGLPAAVSIAYDGGITAGNEVLRIDGDLPPAQILLIDPGAKLEESRLTRASRELQQLDLLPRH